MRQFGEQATLSKAHASMSVCVWGGGEGACVAPAPFNFEMANAPPPPLSSNVVVLAALFVGMKSENPRSVLLYSVCITFYNHILFY